MKVITIKNGNYKIIITPEDEIEKAILMQIAKNSVEIVVPDRIEVIDQNLTDSIIISNVKPIV